MKNISVICKANKTETLSYETCMFIASRHSSATGHLGLPIGTPQPVICTAGHM